MQLCRTFVIILLTLTSVISALPLNPQPLPPGEHVGPHVGERSALPVKERITLTDT
jgi:hypothetical protein